MRYFHASDVLDQLDLDRCAAVLLYLHQRRRRVLIARAYQA